MNISPVNYNSRTAMKADVPKQPVAIINKHEPQTNYPFKYSPALVGVLNGACWAAIGLAFDQAYKALFHAKGSLKTSLILNGLIGLGMGTYAGIKAKKLADSGEVTNWADTKKFNAKK